MKALGMIETFGLIGAIEAADVMLKTANVTLLKKEKVRGGLVLISIAGDVGAVKTAVEAAATAVRALGEQSLYASHVIPRPDLQIDSFYSSEIKKESDEEIKSQRELEEIVVVTEPVQQEIKVDQAEELLSEEMEVVKPNQAQQATSEDEEKLTLPDYKRKLLKLKAAELRDEISKLKNNDSTEMDTTGLTKKQMVGILLDDFEKRNQSKDQ